MVGEHNGSNQLQRTYVTLGLDQNLSLTASGRTYYYLDDALGSIRQVIDANEATQTRRGGTPRRGRRPHSYDYEAFGKVYGTPTENLTQPFRFTGRAWDSESELYYYRLRNYSPSVGSFGTRDPLWPQSGLNSYTYVSNNPVLYLDPFGLIGACRCDQTSRECCATKKGIECRKATVTIVLGSPEGKYGTMPEELQAKTRKAIDALQRYLESHCCKVVTRENPTDEEWIEDMVRTTDSLIFVGHSSRKGVKWGADEKGKVSWPVTNNPYWQKYVIGAREQPLDLVILQGCYSAYQREAWVGEGTHFEGHTCEICRRRDTLPMLEGDPFRAGLREYCCKPQKK